MAAVGAVMGSLWYWSITTKRLVILSGLFVSLGHLDNMSKNCYNFDTS